MSEQLLLRHAERWAEGKRRPIDLALLETVLDLRQSYDDHAPQEWPPGSVSDLLLQRWPAHGPLDLPDLDVLRDSLDTFWRFLRATGRMSAKSASPAQLLKEARRAVRDMPAACADRSNFSQGRVLMDFGRSVGIDLDEAESTEELQARLNQIQDSWNSLPVDERRRLMPDPSPKSATGRAWTASLNDSAADDDEFREGYPELAARDARAAPYILACLGLADWVGLAGKPVTSRGLLKPAVARQAYLDLNIFAWETAYLPYAAGAGTTDPEVLALLERNSANSWRSAGDCDGLDRLWWSCDAGRLVDIRSSKAVRGDRLPTNDDEWLELGLELVLCLALRFADRVMPLTGCLLIQAVSEEPVPLGAVKEWWWERHPPSAFTLPGDDTFWRNLRDGQVDWVVNMFDDTGLWVRHGESLEITEFGRVFAVVMANATEDGAFEDY